MPQSRYFVALMLPEAVEAYANQVIQELSDRYRTRTARAAPHITLQPPFLWADEECETLERAIAEFVQSRPTIPVQLSGFNCFGRRVIYIHVEKTPELLKTQADLMQHLEIQLDLVDPKSKARPFSPHVTVASRNVTPAVFKQAWAAVKERPVDFEFVCDRLTLLIYKQQQWHIHREYALIEAR